jgi:TRAP-type uncharacterized transport system substrate-binding protein
MSKTEAQLSQLKKTLLMQEGVKEIKIRSEKNSNLNQNNEIISQYVISVATFPDRRKEVVDPALIKCFLKETTRLNLAGVVLDIHDKTVDFNPPL